MDPFLREQTGEAGGPSRRASPDRTRAWIWIALALTAFKLWLTAGQTLYAIGGATHDDRLFLNLAQALLHGHWLGPYDCLTLAKGPFYPMWVALVFVLGLPLLQAQQLAYAGACVLVVRALAPALRRGWARLGVYTLLLWNPISFDANEMARVLRQEIYPTLTLLLFAGMIALYYRRTRPWRRLTPWTVLLGLGWAAFWLTREESIWIAPSLLLLGAAIAIAAWRESRAVAINIGRAAAATMVCAAVPILTVCALNYQYYGWFGTVEFRAAAFKDAYGALLRVRPDEVLPFVPVTRATRERIYAVSPAFAELKPYLEGQIGLDWANVSSFWTHQDPQDREIGGGWFMWALRQAVQAAGHAQNARDALDFYTRIAWEVNLACDDGALPAGPRRSGFQPPWQPGQMAQLMPTLVAFADYFTTFRHFSAYSPGSLGSRSELDYFRDLSRMKLSPPVEARGYQYSLPEQDALDGAKLALLQFIGKGLRKVLCVLAYASLGVWLLRGVELAWRRQLTYPFVLAVAALGGCAACLTICALVQVTSFPTLDIAYLAPAYPLLLLFVASVAHDAGLAWRRFRPASGRPPAA